LKILAIIDIGVGFDPTGVEIKDWKKRLDEDICDGKIADLIGIVGIKTHSDRCRRF
jgi:hypothetical protein